MKCEASSLASGVALGWFPEAYASATIGCPKVRTSVVSALFAAGKESATVNMCKAALVLCGKTWGASTQNSMQLLQ